MGRDPIGLSPRRGGGRDRVTGAQEYVADLRGMDPLHVRLVTLEVARARIHSIDTTRAERHPGVVGIITPENLPKPMPRFGPRRMDRPVLADRETRYHGEPVAAVAATTPEAAERGVQLVDVEYEPIPGGVFDIDASLDPSSPLVQDPAWRPDDPLAHTNVLNEHHFGWGDVDSVDADLVVDNTYEFPMITQFALEPHGSIAAPDGDGVTVWSSVQHPFLLQKTLAGLLDLPLSRVRVHAPDPGGGFGGKQIPKYEPLLAFLALQIQRPVRLVLTLPETFQAVRRTSARIRFRTGVSKDGKIVFQDVESNFLIGPFADIADRVTGKSNYFAAGPYRTPNVRIVARSLLSHTTPSTAMRGFGTPQVSWARESNLDEAARRLGVDPVEIRIANLPEFGEEFVPGDTPADGRWDQTLRRAADLIGWNDPLPEGRGRGIALGLKAGPTSGLSYSTVRLLADGSAVVSAGTSDMGQGARTIFAQIVAAQLGVDFDEVTIVMGDTSRVPYDQQTSASRSSVLMGTAISRACGEIRSKIQTMTGQRHGVDPEQVRIEDGSVTWPGGSASLGDHVTDLLGTLGGEIIGNGEMRVDADPDHPLGGRAIFFELHCAACELEVDRETGEIKIHKYVSVGDAGRSVNPKQVAGQDEGAAIMGLGHTLMEQMILDEGGRIVNMGAVDYRILTSLDVPSVMVSDNIENADGPGPFGIKGISEGGLLATSAAVGSAVTAATGVTIRSLPLTPERVWRELLGNDRPSTDED